MQVGRKGERDGEVGKEVGREEWVYGGTEQGRREGKMYIISPYSFLTKSHFFIFFVPDDLDL